MECSKERGCGYNSENRIRKVIVIVNSNRLEKVTFKVMKFYHDILISYSMHRNNDIWYVSRIWDNPLYLQIYFRKLNCGEKSCELYWIVYKSLTVISGVETWYNWNKIQPLSIIAICKSQKSFQLNVLLFTIYRHTIFTQLYLLFNVYIWYIIHK